MLQTLKTKKTASPASFSAALLTLLALGSAACVTVNVNFPESAVQKATDDYVRDLYRAKEKGKTPAPETSQAPTSSRLIFPMFDLIATASADAEANIKVNSDKALKIKDRLASRVEEVLAQKRAGVLGETNDGLLELKGADKVKPLLKKKIEAMVAAENADRTELYAEVAASNGIAKGRIKDIQKSFARSFQAESPSGTWAQDSDGKWAQKP
jgi:uncharacterized protein YdbL (DUF1318 family)